MLKEVRKRDGKRVAFDGRLIEKVIRKAVVACDGKDMEKTGRLSRQVEFRLETKFREKIPSVEDIQDAVEQVLIKSGHAQVAKAFILYRERHAQSREKNALIGATIHMFNSYLDDRDWLVQENANQQHSINGLNNYVREAFTRHYWLNEVLPERVRDAHEGGDVHVHDLGFFGPYCAGWDLRQLLTDGFGGVPGKVESRPAKHLRSFLGQIVNSTFTTQGECAGAQAWGSFDTYCAPFVRKDSLDYAQLRQCLQEFVFNLNVPTRVGFSAPFSNLTFDLTVPSTLANQAVVIGGELQNESYSDFQQEMDLFNQAFCDVMMEGDSKGRVFTFPIPTINVSKNFDYSGPSFKAFLKTAARYGIPYFANYVNSDLSPEDAVSMCCRLRLNTSELRARGGGLFGSNPLTGSIGVFTINLPRLGYRAKSEEEFLELLLEQMETGCIALESKRKMLEKQTEQGLYPYCANFLREVKSRTGNFWHNHFSTIGIIGMHEALVNLLGKGIDSDQGREFAADTMHFMRRIMQRFQTETGHVYNLEATPAEGASHRLALADKKKFPDIYTSGGDTPYYTNSTQLPVDSSRDLLEVIDHQDELQSLYTGGTVQHLFLGEQLSDTEAMGEFLKSVFTNYRLPYLSFTPTFSICPEHNYIAGEHANCPKCGRESEVWSRIVGYLRPVGNWNAGKKREFSERTVHDPESVSVESVFA